MIHIRDAKESDLAFILHTWIGKHQKSHAMKHVDYDLFVPEMRKRVKRLLGSSIVRVAADDKDTDTLIGFLVANPSKNILHYAYVRDTWRKQGVFRGMREGLQIKEVTHHPAPYGEPVDIIYAERNEDGKFDGPRKLWLPKSIVYNPFRLEER
jgi:hypothetical protein